MLRNGLLLTAAIGIAILVVAYRTAIADPIVRRATVAILPPDSPKPVALLLVSDIHVAGPDLPPDRLARIVAQINALRPDVVLIAGDLVSDKRVSMRRYTLAQAIAPLTALRARLGVFAVLGNHDHWRSADRAREELRKANIRVLDNEAARAGPIVIGGLDDAFTRHDDLGATVRHMDRLDGVPVVLSHSPDPFPDLPSRVPLMVAGHTHCGQIRLPLIGALTYMSRYGDRYACGVVRERGRTLVVGAGLGTSVLPLRLGAPPDMWSITLTPASERR